MPKLSLNVPKSAMFVIRKLKYATKHSLRLGVKHLLKDHRILTAIRRDGMTVTYQSGSARRTAEEHGNVVW